MKIWSGIENYPPGQPAVVASIGNYDGVHRGHRAILDSVVRAAREGGRASLLITFEPHPLGVVNPERRPRLLQTRRQKLDALEGTGLDGVLILDFDGETAALDGESFFTRVLEPSIDFAAIHVGENFRFGNGRTGDLELLKRVGDRSGFEVRGIAPVTIDGQTVSSTAIRRAVEAGRVEDARRVLGRPFAMVGEVVRGEGRGTIMDFPTANLDVGNEIVPSNGVYITEVSVLASRRPAVTNVGVRPTFGGKVVHVETHLLHFDGDLYAETMEVRFLVRLREEMQFPGPIELADQVARDRAAAEAFFQNVPLTPS
jgi:riboflavin kinase/FMN adenylyltransferase